MKIRPSAKANFYAAKQNMKRLSLDVNCCRNCVQIKSFNFLFTFSFTIYLIRRYPTLCVSAYEHFIFLGRFTNPRAKTPRTKRSWTPQETMATRRCRNRSNDLIIIIIIRRRRRRRITMYYLLHITEKAYSN